MFVLGAFELLEVFKCFQQHRGCDVGILGEIIHPSVESVHMTVNDNTSEMHVQNVMPVEILGISMKAKSTRLGLVHSIDNDG